MPKQYVFLSVLFLFTGKAATADDAVEHYELSAPPLYFHIDRRPERPLHYGLCLLQIKNGDEQDRIGVVSPLESPKKACPSQDELNQRTPAEREAAKKMTRVYDNPEVDGDRAASAVMNGRAWRYGQVVGFFRKIETPEKPEGLWDPFCVARLETVDGEYEEKLLICNKKKAGVVKAGEKPPPFVCENIVDCVGRKEELKIEKPVQIGKVAGSGRTTSGTTEVTPVSSDGKKTGGKSSGGSGATH